MAVSAAGTERGGVATALQRVLEFLKSAQPRRLRPALRDVIFVYTDASQEGVDNLDMGLGAVVQDHEGTILGWFGLVLPRDVAEDVLRDGKKCINELESLTVALTVRLCAAILLQRHVVFYLDNEAARVTLLRMQSENAMLDAVAKISAVHEAELSCIPWYARVPSRSNIADAPSRCCFLGLPNPCRINDDVVVKALREVLRQARRFVAQTT